MTDLFENPMGTDGFEFVEYASKNPEELEKLFTDLGFTEVAKHKAKNVTLWRQGGINFILNKETDGQPRDFTETHGPSANAMAFRIKDVPKAMARAKEQGYEIVESNAGPLELTIPALKGIGGSLVYLVDTYGDAGEIYDTDFDFHAGVERHPKGAGLYEIDHLTHNVSQGNMDKWANYYTDLFNFREIRYFDIAGKVTGLKSRAMTSPDGKIRIPINESSDDKSQIEEYLREHNGEGIQHIALASRDIFESVESLRADGMEFMDTPDTYFDRIDARVPNHGHDVERMRKNRILIDGEGIDKTHEEELLLQIFTNTVIGPLFFEVIQRKGNEGFGEGNFQALFESIEEDQIKRGVIEATG
ncbi:MAG: 4-hydroxyphenylpyruvate dioxygenase [Rickettsiales bacterium]|nr:4-hydroxyphenylpyruvate dioxygenase [Rickettsiales bacterium]